LYETPPEAVQALLRVERIPHCVWECCAGKGAIVRVLRDAGHAVIASDIIDYGFPLHFVADFLEMAARLSALKPSSPTYPLNLPRGAQPKRWSFVRACTC
jgi:hypothetical protein